MPSHGYAARAAAIRTIPAHGAGAFAAMDVAPARRWLHSRARPTPKHGGLTWIAIQEIAADFAARAGLVPTKRKRPSGQRRCRWHSGAGEGGTVPDQMAAVPPL